MPAFRPCSPLAALALALVLGGLCAACAPTCDEACSNVAAICEDRFPAEDKAACLATCEGNLDGCKNLDEQKTCVAEVATCDAVKRCPECLR